MELQTTPNDPRGLPARHISPDTAQNALPAGALVFTLDGALPVEFISAGDRVITRDSGTAVVRDVRHERREVETVSISAGSLGSSCPDRDAVLPAGQEVLVRDWRAQALFGASRALVRADALVDGEFVRHGAAQSLDLIELVFDAPHILYADGIEVAAKGPLCA